MITCQALSRKPQHWAEIGTQHTVRHSDISEIRAAYRTQSAQQGKQITVSFGVQHA